MFNSDNIHEYVRTDNPVAALAPEEKHTRSPPEETQFELLIVSLLYPRFQAINVSRVNDYEDYEPEIIMSDFDAEI